MPTAGRIVKPTLYLLGEFHRSKIAVTGKLLKKANKDGSRGRAREQLPLIYWAFYAVLLGNQEEIATAGS